MVHAIQNGRRLLAAVAAVLATGTVATAATPTGVPGCFFYGPYDIGGWFGWTGYCLFDGNVIFFDNAGGWCDNITC